MKKEFGTDYASIADVNFKTKYRANCYCSTVQRKTWVSGLKDMGVRPTQLTDRRRGLNLPLALVMICGTSICNSVTKRSSVISLTIPSPFLT